MSEFEGTKIVKMDESATKAGLGEMMEVALSIAPPAPAGFVPIFNTIWSGTMIMIKRKATMTSSRITVTCTLPEVQGLIPELNKALHETTVEYNRRIAVEEKSDEQRRQREAASKAAVADTAKNLKFD